MQGNSDIREVTCVRCPAGCVVEVAVDAAGGARYVGGAACARGRDYALSEATSPRRMVATTVPVPGFAEPLSVKTAAPIPKELVAQAVREAKRAAPAAPIRVGDVVCPDVCGTGVDMVATKALP